MEGDFKISLKLLAGFGTGYPYHHALHHFVSGGAIFHVLLVHVHVIDHAPFGMMRESCTVSRPHFVNAAFVGRQVEELAGLQFIHPVVLTLVEVQPFFFEL